MNQICRLPVASVGSAVDGRGTEQREGRLGFNDGNAMYLLNQRALIDHGHAGPESDGPTPFMAEFRLWLGKVAGRHSWIARCSAWLLGTEIHVSPMSGTWLRAFEGDWHKRGADV